MQPSLIHHGALLYYCDSVGCPTYSEVWRSMMQYSVKVTVQIFTLLMGQLFHTVPRICNSCSDYQNCKGQIKKNNRKKIIILPFRTVCRLIPSLANGTGSQTTTSVSLWGRDTVSIALWLCHCQIHNGNLVVTDATASCSESAIHLSLYI